MNEYAIESFIAFCDDMMIAEEKFNFKSAGQFIITGLKRFISKIILFIKKVIQIITKDNMRYTNPSVYSDACTKRHDCENIYKELWEYGQYTDTYKFNRDYDNLNLHRIFKKNVSLYSKSYDIDMISAKKIVDSTFQDVCDIIKKRDYYGTVVNFWSFLTDDFIDNIKRNAMYNSYTKYNYGYREYKDKYDLRVTSSLMYEDVKTENMTNAVVSLRQMLRDTELKNKYINNTRDGVSYWCENFVSYCHKISPFFDNYIEKLVMTWNQYLLEYQRCDVYNYQKFEEYIVKAGML